jgi:hypothetical protein
MALEEWADLVPEPAPGLSLGVLVALEEMVGEGEDVFAPLSQRRDVDARHGDSIEGSLTGDPGRTDHFAAREGYACRESGARERERPASLLR